MSLSGYFKQRVPLKGRHMISFTVNEVTCLMSRNSLPSPPPSRDVEPYCSEINVRLRSHSTVKMKRILIFTDFHPI